MTDITPEWLQEIGFNANGNEDVLRLYILDDYEVLCVVFPVPIWFVNQNPFPLLVSPKTRDEVLRLCAAMGHQVQVPTCDILEPLDWPKPWNTRPVESTDIPLDSQGRA